MLSHDKVLVLCEHPPKTIGGEIEKNWKVGVKKTRKRILDQSEAEKLKKVVLKRKNFTRRWWRCVRGEGGWLGGWRVGG